MFCSGCNRFLESLQEFPTFEIVFANDLKEKRCIWSHGYWYLWAVIDYLWV